ncbi:hypothetical protein M8360_31590, partial [Klebsiella pneumoniae]|nr:hypothetical protein [Klebsiella pneumoniae]
PFGLFIRFETDELFSTRVSKAPNMVTMVGYQCAPRGYSASVSELIVRRPNNVAATESGSPEAAP